MAMNMDEKKKHSRRRGCLISLLTTAGILVLTGIVSSLTNLGLPESQSSDRLDPLDQARLAEALNLKFSLGTALWPEWADTRNPLILWNHAYEFLVNYPVTPPLDWESVQEGSFNGWP